MLNLAKNRPATESVHWINGYVQELGNTNADLAIMTGHVAQFFIDDASWQAALKCIHGALKPGGYIAFESRNPHVSPFNTWPASTTRRKSMTQ